MCMTLGREHRDTDKGWEPREISLLACGYSTFHLSHSPFQAAPLLSLLISICTAFYVYKSPLLWSHAASPTAPCWGYYHQPQWLGRRVVMSLKSKVGTWRWGLSVATQLQALGSPEPRFVQPDTAFLSLYTHHFQQVFPDGRSPLPLAFNHMCFSHLHRQASRQPSRSEVDWVGSWVRTQVFRLCWIHIPFASVEGNMATIN